MGGKRTCTCVCAFCLHAGYVQGMSDLLAPLLAVMENEVDTFWCFVGFMDTVVSRCRQVHNYYKYICF